MAEPISTGAGICIMLVTAVVILIFYKIVVMLMDWREDLGEWVFDGRGIRLQKILPFIFYLILSSLYIVLLIIALICAVSLANDVKKW